jgi:pyruvate ferredoxin oxidoreductase alpha subunit
MNKDQQLLNASEAIALTVSRLNIGVVSAYPITPQTKIVEKLSQLKETKGTKFEFVRAESEFAAASIVLGASAAGTRAYTATSSQGLLMMLEVLYNISGLRLPVVLTCANRSVSAPLNIWNDHSDVMAARDAGWILLFAENNQEAVNQHVLAYKLAEKLKIPVMVNVDGFILTHQSEPVCLPDTASIKKFLPPLPASANQLNTKTPSSLGLLVGPNDFYKFRQKINDDFISALKTINQEYAKFQIIFKTEQPGKQSIINNGLLELYGSPKAQTIFVAMGSVVGTIKQAIDDYNSQSLKFGKLAVLKIKSFRPFPTEAIKDILKNKRVIIINKAISPGSLPPLSAAVAMSLNQTKTDFKHVVAGLGGQDITVDDILGLLKEKSGNEVVWVK